MAKTKLPQKRTVAKDDRFTFVAGPLAILIREAAAIEGTTTGEWIRQACADRLGVDSQPMRRGNPSLTPLPETLPADERQARKKRRKDTAPAAPTTNVDILSASELDSALKLFVD